MQPSRSGSGGGERRRSRGAALRTAGPAPGSAGRRVPPAFPQSFLPGTASSSSSFAAPSSPGGSARAARPPPRSATAPLPRRHWSPPRSGGSRRALIGCARPGGAPPRSRAALAGPRRGAARPARAPRYIGGGAASGASRGGCVRGRAAVEHGLFILGKNNIFSGAGGFPVPLLARLCESLWLRSRGGRC